MKASTIYRKAAKQIETGESDFCCLAIQSICDYQNNTSTPIVYFFSTYFRPNPIDENWFGDIDVKENQEHRETALLLMAEISESEGL